jgi:hypothetical protein
VLAKKGISGVVSYYPVSIVANKIWLNYFKADCVYIEYSFRLAAVVHGRYQLFNLLLNRLSSTAL